MTISGPTLYLLTQKRGTHRLLPLRTRRSRSSFFGRTGRLIIIKSSNSWSYSLPSYEASHEFDKRGRRQQHHQPHQPVPPPMPHRPHPDSYGQMGHPNGHPPQRPYFNQGPPPPRNNDFRPAPIPPPPFAAKPVPPAHYNHPSHGPNNFGPGGSYLPPPPALWARYPPEAPPIRFGQGPIQPAYAYPNNMQPQWDPSKQNRPPHLPPRPPAPMGRGDGGYHNGRDRQGNRGGPFRNEAGPPPSNGGLYYG